MLIGDRSTWGIAAMNAYRAYGDDQVLQHAILMWNFTLPYFVTEDEAAAGKHPKRNDSLQLAKTCNGGEDSTIYAFSICAELNAYIATTAGAVFSVSATSLLL